MAIIKPLQTITLKNEGGEDTTYVVASAPAIVETTEPASVASFADGAAGIPVKSLVADINPVQTGSGDPSPNNIRPITGWTGMNVVRNGFNQWDEVWENGYYNRATGAKAGDTDTKYFRSKNFIPCLPDTQYYFKAPATHASNNTYYAVLFYDADKTFISSDNGLAQNPTKTSPSNARYMTFYVEVGTSGATYNNDISINYPSTDHDYHAYKGTTYPISWADEAGTVYGGTLNVTTGLLTVTHGVKVLDGTTSYSWSANNSLATTSITNGVVISATTQGNVYTQNSTFKDASWASRNSVDGTIGMFYGTSALYMKYSQFTSADDAKAFFTNNPTTVVYQLATPTTYQLTPQAVLTVLGQNNIWADTGDVEVAYCADTKMYIDKVIAAL